MTDNIPVIKTTEDKNTPTHKSNSSSNSRSSSNSHSSSSTTSATPHPLSQQDSLQPSLFAAEVVGEEQELTDLDSRNSRGITSKVNSATTPAHNHSPTSPVGAWGLTGSIGSEENAQPGVYFPLGLNYKFELSLNQYIDDYNLGDQQQLLTNLLRKLNSLPQLVDFRVMLAGDHKSLYNLITRACYDYVANRNFFSDIDLDFIDMREFMQSHYPYELTSHSNKKFLVINDFTLVVGHQDWEEAAYDLIQKILVNQCVVIFSGVDASLDKRLYKIPDLHSRLEMFHQMYLSPYTHEEYLTILNRRATEQGLQLKPQVLEYIANIFSQTPDLNIDRSFFKLMRLCTLENVSYLRVSLTFVKKHINEFLTVEPIDREKIKHDNFKQAFEISEEQINNAIASLQNLASKQ